MHRRYALLAFGLLVTGPLVTITANLMDNTSARGSDAPGTVWGGLEGETDEVHSFDHPFFQAACMFLAQSVCLVGHFAVRGRPRRPLEPGFGLETAGCCPKLCAEAEFWLALPAACDVLGMGTLYAGLCLTYASVCEMLRCSASLVFTTLFSALFLRRTVYLFQWIALHFSAAGIFVVVHASTRDDAFSTKDSSMVLLGNLLVLLAQVLIATQICLEERMVAARATPALKLVGAEGFWGLLILCCLLVPMQFIQVNGQPIENIPDAFSQVRNSGVLSTALILYIFGAVLWNFLGIFIAESMDASNALIIDSLRTVIVWAVSVSIGWEKFRPLQVLGFVLMFFGAAVHNMVLTLPFVRYPRMPPPGESVSLTGPPETDHSSFHRSFHA